MLNLASGKYELTSPSYIDRPYKVDHSKEVYMYVVSKYDNQGQDIRWAIEQMSNILNQSRLYPEYRVEISFHLFEAEDALSKTAVAGKLLVDVNEKKVMQYMYTERNIDYVSYTYSTLIEFKNKVLEYLGWENDR